MYKKLIKGLIYTNVVRIMLPVYYLPIRFHMQRSKPVFYSLLINPVLLACLYLLSASFLIAPVLQAGNNSLHAWGNNVKAKRYSRDTVKDGNITLSLSVLGLQDKAGQPLKKKFYMPGGYITYRLHIENTSAKNMTAVPLVDVLSGVTTDWFDGSSNKAFESWKIESSVDSGGVSHAGSVADNKNIQTTIDIGVGGFVEYTVSVKINEEAVGPIGHSAKVFGLEVVSETVRMARPQLFLKKEAFSDRALTLPIEGYWPSQKIFYVVTIANRGDGTFYNEKVNDTISAITTSLSDTESTYATNPKGSPFSKWHVSARHQSGRVTHVGNFVEGDNIDIDTFVAIAPHDSLNFIIEADIIFGAVGDIINVVSVDKKAVSKSLQGIGGDINIEKGVISVGGQLYNPYNPFYAPGDEVVYLLILDNFKEGWANDLHILDKISDMRTELLGGGTGQAFSSWHTEVTVSRKDGVKPYTYVPQQKDNEDIDISLDIAPSETVTVLITAKVRLDALGIIPRNVLKAGINTVWSDELMPITTTIESSKEPLDSVTGDISTYANNGMLKWRVTVTNTGRGYARDIHIKDAIDTMRSSDGQLAFKDDYQVVSDNGERHLSDGRHISRSMVTQGNDFGNNPLDIIATIAPGDKLSFVVTAHVNADVTGTILNTFSVTGLPDATAGWTPIPAIFRSEKTQNVKTYAPGDTVDYTLVVTNASQVVGQVTVVDEIANLLVETIDGTMKPAFTDIKARYVIEGDKTISEVKAPLLDANNNLNTHIKLAGDQNPGAATPVYSRVVFTLSGKVREDAVGDIINRATVGSETVTVEPIKPVPPEIEMDNVATLSPNEYTPGESIGFDILLKNTGKGFSKTTHFEDKLANLLTEVVDGTKQQVIKKWDVVTVSFSSEDSKAVAGKAVNDAKGYRNDFIIKPGDTVTVHLEGKVASNAVGVITNIGEFEESNTAAKGEISASYHSLPGILALEKVASEPSFIAGDIVHFDVKAKNTGKGWLTKTMIVDDLDAITTELVGGATGKAFVDNTLTVTVDGLSADQVVLDIRGNKMVATVNMPPSGTAVFHLAIQTQSTVVGPIKNVVTSDGDSAEVVIAPEQGVITIRKKTLTPNYEVAGEIQYQVVVSNNSASIVNDAQIKDALSAVRVDTLDGTPKPAFSQWQVSLVTDEGNDIIDNHTGQRFVSTNNVDLDVNADLLPKTSATFTITGTVIAEAAGDITNVATARVGGEEKSSHATVKPSATHVSRLKVSDLSAYTPGETLKFTLKVKNTSKNNIVKQRLVDDLSKTTVLLADGSTGPAFVAGTTMISPPPLPHGSVVTKVNDATFDVSLPPGTEVSFIAQGIVVDNAVGDIQNTASFNGDTFHSDSVLPIKPMIEITKTASQSPNEYSPGETIGFDVLIKNTGKVFSMDTYFEDNLASLVTDVAGGKQAQVVTTWDVATVSFSSAESRAILGKAINDVQGYRNDFVIKPGDTVAIHLEGKVVDNAVGVINSTGTFTEMLTSVTGEASAAYHAAPGSLALTATVKTPAFIAGDTVVFDVAVINTGKGWLTNTVIVDDLDAITTELVGGQMGKAFVGNTLQVTVDGMDKNLVKIAKQGNKMIATGDIPPGKTIHLHVSAKTLPTVVGTINNVVESGSESSDVVIDPVQGTVSIETQSLTPTYAVGEPVSYQVLVKNNSAAVVNDAVISDVVSAIKIDTLSGSQQSAFSEWTISLVADAGNVVVDNKAGQPFVTLHNQDLAVKADLLPHSQLAFTVTGTITPEATGIFKNTATASVDGDVKSDENTIQPGQTSVATSKVADMAEYKPGQALAFTLKVKNTSTNNIVKALMIDDVTKTQVVMEDGTRGSAFLDGSTSLDVIAPVPAGSTATKINATTFEVTLIPGAEVAFTAQGTVVPRAIGGIQNTAFFEGGDISNTSVRRELPKITADFQVKNNYYIPGEPLEYRLRLTNDSDFPAMGVEVETQFHNVMGEHVQSKPVDSDVSQYKKAFDVINVSATTDGGVVSDAGELIKGKDVETKINIGANRGFVEYTIIPHVHKDLVSAIDVVAYYHFSFWRGDRMHHRAGDYRNSQSLPVNSVPPMAGKMVTTKIADKERYNDDDRKISYTLSAKNVGSGNMNNVHLKDAINSLVSQKTGKPIFTDWTYTVYENGSTVPSEKKVAANTNLDLPWGFASNGRNSIQIKVEATLASKINEDVKNVFQAVGSDGLLLDQSDVTTAVNQKEVNQGELNITKVALQPQIQPSGTVEYELLIENLNDTPFDGFSVEDHYPAGFRYVENSSRIIRSKGGRFSEGYETIAPAEVSTRLVYQSLKVDAQEKIRIRYVLKASIGVSFGQYKNLAYASNEGGGKISNDGFAMVAVLGDKVFDTTSITGKVFDDHNGNGYQSDATARNIVVTMPIPSSVYVANSARLILGDHSVPIKASHQCPFNKGVKIPEVWGQSNNRHTQATKATLTFKTCTADNYPMSVISSTGSEIYFDKQGKTTKKAKGSLKKGLSSEDLYVTRNIYKQADGYFWEIIIDNQGQYDDGIPGVRLMTPEGFKIETDSFGRFHVPDRWIFGNKGRNYVIKVDTDSLPAGMNIISENPKVLRITPHKINKINFSAQKKR